MEEQTGVVLLMHEGIIYEDDVVNLHGHAYINCTFRRCHMIYRKGPGYMKNSSFDGCIWEISTIIHDHQAIQSLKEILEVVGATLPGLPPDSRPTTPPEPQTSTEEESGVS